MISCLSFLIFFLSSGRIMQRKIMSGIFFHVLFLRHWIILEMAWKNVLRTLKNISKMAPLTIFAKRAIIEEILIRFFLQKKQTRKLNESFCRMSNENLTLHKKWSFPFRISSVNMIKSAVSILGWGLVPIVLDWKDFIDNSRFSWKLW